MPLQTQNLVMVGLGIKGDTPPNPLQPPLADGIHLRWAFTRDLGFPWYGFYLFRRPHREGNPLCLSQVITNLSVGSRPTNTLDTSYGQIRSDKKLILTDKFPPSGTVEFDLDKRRYLRFTLSPQNLARRVEARIGFRTDAPVGFRPEVPVTALLWNNPVAQVVARGRPGQVVTVSLEFDAITDVQLESGPAALVDLCFVPVTQQEMFAERLVQEERIGWELVRGFTYPMSLPLTHPDYPCTPGINEDLSRARAAGRQRIRYGDPNQFTSPPVLVQTTGTISIVNGSPLVRGTNTNWRSDRVGDVLVVAADSTSYTIIEVIAPDKLVLSRSYSGGSRTGTTYSIYQDPFGQFHDNLVQLIKGGISAGAMANRSIPVPISSGTLHVLTDNPMVTGIGTNWTEDFVGLALEIIDVEITAGTVEVFRDSPIVIGTGTNWGASLVGLTFQINGDRKTYTIKSINSQTLILEGSYAGDSGSGKAYSITQKTPYTIVRVDSPTQLTLDRGYTETGAEFGLDRIYNITGRLQPEEPGGAAPLMPRQYPLDWVLMATLHPAAAQISGLYWVDQATDPAVAYDYLIVADRDGSIGRAIFAADGIQNWLAHIPDFGNADRYIDFNRRVAPAPALLPPDDVRVYALPGGTVRTQPCDVQDFTNNAGLRWNRGLTDLGVVRPGQAIMYHLWRADLGNGATPSTPGSYNIITKEQPVLPIAPLETPQFPAEWPPFQLHAIDRGLADGWYSYQVSGIDVFGRHSANSAAAAWYQWEPAPDILHPSAVQLLDIFGPPSPTGIEAYALDPLDPTVLKDAAFINWWNTLTASQWYRDLSDEEKKNLIGLRVRWLWTQAHMDEAPDTREFRIYYHPGQMNVVVGRTVTVTGASNTESDVETDIVNTRPVNAYTGAWLQIGPDNFEIVTSESSSPLRVRVKTGPVVSNGTISANDGSPTITGNQTSWDRKLTGSSLQVATEPTTYTILAVDATRQQLTLDRNYVAPTGSGGNPKPYTIFGRLPRANAPCRIMIPPVYSAGTVTVTGGASSVTGNATNWNANFAGSEFQVARDSIIYTVVSVTSPTQLVLDRNFEQVDDQGRPITLSDHKYIIRHEHPLFEDFTAPTKWDQRYYVVGYNEHVTETVPPIRVPPPDGRELRGNAATVTGNVVALDGNPDLSGIPPAGEYLVLSNDLNRVSQIYRITAIDDSAKTVSVDGSPNIGNLPSPWQIIFLLKGDVATIAGNVVTLEVTPDLSAIRLEGEHLFLANDTNNQNKTYCINDADISAKTVTVDGTPNIGSTPSPWVIGFPLRSYEVFLPEPSGTFREGLPLTPTLSEPIFYAHISVSAADDKRHRHDDPIWSEPGRGGWGGSERYGNEGSVGAPAKIFRLQRVPPDPPVPPPPDSDRVYASPADYYGRSFYTYRWQLQSGLKTHIFRALDDSVFQSDWGVARRTLDPNNNSDDRKWFPSESNEPRWDAVKRQQVANELNALQALKGTISMTEAMARYRGLSNDGLRVLAGLPENSLAFTQITIQPLDPDNPDNADKRGPDSPDNYIPNPTLRAYIDTLDGHAAENRYFYRATYVDGAHNRSELSLSTVPIWLRDVVPPRTPVMTKVIGGDRQITLKWASNREPDLAEYRVYRADSLESARDLRLMTLVHVEPVPAGDPLERPAELMWTNTSVPGLVMFYYRIVGLDQAGNVSEPSDAITASAYDYTPPAPPEWTRVEWVLLDESGIEHQWGTPVPIGSHWIPAVALAWNSSETGLRAIPQRRRVGAALWRSFIGMLPVDQRQAYDRQADSTTGNYYRLIVQKTSGNQNVIYVERFLPKRA
jgi:hypothetical protein